MNKATCFILSMFLLSIGIWYHHQSPICTDAHSQCTQRTVVAKKEVSPVKEQEESSLSPVRFGTLYLWAKAFAWLPNLIKKPSVAI